MRCRACRQFAGTRVVSSCLLQNGWYQARFLEDVNHCVKLCRHLWVSFRLQCSRMSMCCKTQKFTLLDSMWQLYFCEWHARFLIHQYIYTYFRLHDGNFRCSKWTWKFRKFWHLDSNKQDTCWSCSMCGPHQSQGCWGYATQFEVSDRNKQQDMCSEMRMYCSRWQLSFWGHNTDGNRVHQRSPTMLPWVGEVLLS